MVVIRAGAELIGMALNAFVAIWLSRAVGADGLGYFAVTQTIVRFGGAITGAGLPTVGSQRVAHDADSAHLAWSVVTSARLVLAIIAVAAAELAALISPIGDPNIRRLIQLTAPAWLFLAVTSEWLLVATGQVLAVSVSRVVGALVAAVTAVAVIRDSGDLEALSLVILAPTVVAAVVTVVLIALWDIDVPRIRIASYAGLRSYGADAWQYLKADLSVLTYNSIDRLFLYVLATPAIVGYYEAAYKLIQPFYAISVVVNDSLFKRMAQSIRAPETAQSTIRVFSDLMFVATVPVGFFLVLFAGPVVTLIYGPAFVSAGTYLALLGWVITLGYLAGAVSIPFMAWHRPREYANALIAGNVANLAGNVLLIPPFAAAGAAVATILAKLAVAVVGYFGFRKTTTYPIVNDFLLYAAISGLSLTAAATAEYILRIPSLIAALVFVATYVCLVVPLRWHRYLRMPIAVSEQLDDEFPGSVDPHSTGAPRT